MDKIITSHSVKECCDVLIKSSEISNCCEPETNEEKYSTPLCNSLTSIRTKSCDSKTSIRTQTSSFVKDHRSTQCQLIKLMPKNRSRRLINSKRISGIDTIRQKKRKINFNTKQTHYRLEHTDCPFRGLTSPRRNYRDSVPSTLLTSSFLRSYRKIKGCQVPMNVACQTNVADVSPSVNNIYVDSALQTHCDYTLKLKDTGLIENLLSLVSLTEVKNDKSENEEYPENTSVKQTESDLYFDADQFQAYTTKTVSFLSSDTDKSIDKGIMCAFSPCDSEEFSRSIKMSCTSPNEDYKKKNKFISSNRTHILVNGTSVPIKDKHAMMDWNDYHRLDVIYTFLNTLESRHPSSCTVFNIGKTAENRDIKMINISNGNAANHSVWIDAGIHGREWIAPAVCTYIINYLGQKFNRLPSYLTNKDWYIVPVLNPDGYEHSHVKDRMWRKNRARYANITGVDINRNFSVGWTDALNLTKPQNFSGPAPFSENESIAVRNMLINTDVAFSIYISLHCYGQLILFPYSHTTALCNDYVRLLEGASHMSKAVYELTGINYKVGISKDIMYGACGTSTDWAYEVANIPFCYTIELRNTEHRFAPPGDQIKECGEEIVNCITALMKYFDREGRKYIKVKSSKKSWKNKAKDPDYFKSNRKPTLNTVSKFTTSNQRC